MVTEIYQEGGFGEGLEVGLSVYVDGWTGGVSLYNV